MGIFFDKKQRYGCGSGIFFVNDDVFYPACKQHDIDYMDKIITKKEADLDFYEYMRGLAITRWDKIRAWIYYRIVRMFGWIFWRK